MFGRIRRLKSTSMFGVDGRADSWEGLHIVQG